VPDQPPRAPLDYGIAPPAHRLPDATHLGAVHLLVSDLARSRAYYEEVLGLGALAVDRDRVTLGSRHDERALVILHTRPGVTPARRGAFGLFHFAILLPDRAALGRFAAHLSALGIRAGMADHLVSEALYLSDPDGLGIEVYADRPRDSWRHRDRELAMTTDPLDLAAVVADGGGIAWSGAPAGTTMGHVHLHVGSLDDGAAFYHRALGFDKMVWSYPGALFLAAGGYHHHLGTNVWARGPAPSASDAQLLEWQVVVPTEQDAAAALRSVRDAGYTSEPRADGGAALDPWGTRVRLLARPESVGQS
jgi:catechol 2,3-dioxygenase